MCWKKLKVFIRRMSHRKPRKQAEISLLIPFSSKDRIRRRNFKWLLQYWKHELPEAEIVIGKPKSKIFCKGEALNNAVSKSTGKVLVILDADAYLSGRVIRRCARRMLEELHYGNHLWYVPYRDLYRLTKDATEKVIESNPEHPYRFPSPPPRYDVEEGGYKSKYGARYGAMIMMFPRKAYELLGCFDERFRGWGGEDVALLRALDTLFGKHKTTRNDILHLWHPFLGEDYKSRRWDGQNSGGSNSKLAIEYHKASRHPSKMRELVEEGCIYTHCKQKNREFYGRP